jgi:hypothetical protein
MPAVKFDIKKLDFSSPTAAAAAWRKGGFGETHVLPALNGALKQSPDAVAAFAAGLMGGGAPLEKTVALSPKLVAWATELTPKQSTLRRAVLDAYKISGTELLFAHHLAAMTPAKARLFVADYQAAELSPSGLAEWFRLAGKAVRENSAAGRPKKSRGRSASPKKSKGLVGEVAGLIEDGGAKIGASAKTLADAVEHSSALWSAVVNDIANRAVNEVADFIAILQKAGRPLTQVLVQAAEHGSLVLKKFVHGALDAGHDIEDVVAWAVTQPGETIKSVLQALIDLGKRLSEMVAMAARQSPAAARLVARHLSEIGQTAGAVLASAAAQCGAVLEAVVQGVLDAGRSLRDMLAAAANMTAELARGTVQALLRVGTKPQDILSAVAQESASVVREVVAALIAVGRKTSEILEFLIRQPLETGRMLLSALLRSGQSLASLLKEGLKLTKLGFHAVLRAMLGAGIAVGEILTAVATGLPDAVSTTLEGLLQIGVRLTDVVRSILTDVLEGFRKTFFEGLVALGRSPLEILKAAAETGPAALFLGVTAFFESWGGIRGLSERERQEAEAIFGSAIDLGRVRIVTGKIPAEVVEWLNARPPFTTMYLLNFPEPDAPRHPGAPRFAALIHELVHVWQGAQNGPIYQFHLACTQLRAGRSYTTAELERNAGDLSRFTPEQQAALVEDFWKATRSGSDVSGLPAETLLQAYAKHVYRPLRGRAAARAAAERTRLPLAARRAPSSSARNTVPDPSSSRPDPARKVR